MATRFAFGSPRRPASDWLALRAAPALHNELDGLSGPFYFVSACAIAADSDKTVGPRPPRGSSHFACPLPRPRLPVLLLGSLAALELRQRGLESLALPLVGGTRGYEVRELLGTILEHALAWLRVARDLEAVNIYLVDRGALAEWDATMDTLLGRRSVDAAQDSLVRAIRAELLALIASPRLASFGPEWRPPLERIRSALSTSRIRIEDVAVPARSVAELVAFRYAAPATASPAKMTLAEATSVLRKEGQVAPWIVSHLDCLRYFGNAAAHSQSPVSYRPPGLCEEDLPALLASLHRVIAFHLSPSETVG